MAPAQWPLNAIIAKKNTIHNKGSLMATRVWHHKTELKHGKFRRLWK